MSVSEALLPQPEAGIGCTFLNDELKTFTHYLLPFLPLGQRLAGVRSPAPAWPAGCADSEQARGKYLAMLMKIQQTCSKCCPLL